VDLLNTLPETGGKSGKPGKPPESGVRKNTSLPFRNGDFMDLDGK